MKIFDVVQFDENEVRIFEKASRWASVIKSFTFNDEKDREATLKAVSRLNPHNQHEFKRNHIQDSKLAWTAIRDELKRRIQQFEAVRDGKATLFATGPLAEGAVPLVADERGFAIDMMQTLAGGLDEVQALIDILSQAHLAMKDPPDDESYYESEEYGEQDIDAVVVRR